MKGLLSTARGPRRAGSTKSGPLRDITKAIRFDGGGVKTRVFVELSCGHRTWTGEGSERARCADCKAAQ